MEREECKEARNVPVASWLLENFPGMDYLPNVQDRDIQSISPEKLALYLASKS